MPGPIHSKSLKAVFQLGGLLLALSFPWLLSGCASGLAYTDPNVPAGERYFNTVGAHPLNPAGGQSGAATATQPVNVTVTQPALSTGAQPVNPAGSQTIKSAAAQPAPVAVTTNSSLLPGTGSSKLGVGDLLTINFSDVPPGALPIEQQHRVGDDGLITLPFNVQVQAAGKTPTQLQKEIRNAYVPSLFVNLTVVVKAQDRYVYVDGEVKVPNKIFHQDGLTVLRAISTVGGFTDFANKKKIEVRRAIGGKVELVDWSKARKNPKLDLPLFVNDQVYVPRGIL